MTSPETTRPEQRRVRMGNFGLDALTEREVIDTVREAWAWPERWIASLAWPNS
jgi:hypothetical protein